MFKTIFFLLAHQMLYVSDFLCFHWETFIRLIESIEIEFLLK